MISGKLYEKDWLTNNSRRYSKLLIIIFLLAFLLRVGLSSVFQGLNFPPKYDAQPDQVDYEQLAYHLSLGKGYTNPAGVPTASRPPGTSLILFPIYTVFGRSFLVARLWFCLISAATCLAVAWLARQCYGPFVGLISAAWLAFYPGHFYYAMHFVSEVPFGLWLTLACGFTVRSFAKEKAPGCDAIAGVLWGLCILTRPQIVFALPILWVSILLMKIRRTRNMAHLALQTCALVAVLSPWLVRNTLVMGKPTLSTVGGYTFWGAHNDIVLYDPQLRGSWVRTSDLVDSRHPLSGTEIQKEASAWQYGIDFVQQHPSKMPQLIGMKIWRLISPFTDTTNTMVYMAFAVGWLVTLPLALIGFRTIMRECNLGTMVLVASILSTLLTVFIFYGSARFRDSIAPVFVILAARGIFQIIRTRFPDFELTMKDRRKISRRHN